MKKSLQKPIVLYIILSYAVTWIWAFGLVVLHQQGHLSVDQLHFYHAFAALGPTFGALVAAQVCYGSAGLAQLWRSIGFPKLNAKTLAIVLSPLGFFLFGLLLFALIKQEWYDFEAFAAVHWSSMDALVLWLLPLLTYSIFEEIGWRGFLLPHLQTHYNAWQATIVLAFIWALWHLPFFFYRFEFSLFISIGFFFGIFVGTVILTSLYNSSRGLLFPVMLFHFFNNFCSEFDKEIVVAVLSTGFVFVAVSVYKRYGPTDLSPVPRVKNYFITSSNT